MRYPLVLGAALAACSASAQVYVQSSLIDDYRVEAGERVEGVVPLVNETDSPRRVRAYLADYQFDAEGSTWYDAPGSAAHSAAGWVSVGAPEVVVPARATTELRYSVRVPADAALDETRWCVLMVEDVGQDESAASPQASGPQLGTRRRVRFAVQIAVVLGDPAPALRVAETRLSGAGGALALWADVVNDGTGHADTTVSLDVFDAQGRSVRLEGTRGRLYPGSSLRHQVSLADVGPGTYQALLIVDAGDEHTVGVPLVLDVEG